MLKNIMPADFNFKNINQYIDEQLLVSCVLLIIIGIIMVYSASIAFAAHDARNAFTGQYHFLFRHIINLIIGLVFGFYVFKLPTSQLKKYTPYFFIIICF